MRIEEIAKKIGDAKIDCQLCGQRLHSTDCGFKDHEGGIKVEGYDKPQWIYFRCKKCGFLWALWKLARQIKESMVKV